MSAPPEEYPCCPVPLAPAEVIRSRKEDPAFAEVLGRARAKALRVPYNPEIHHPNAPRKAKYGVSSEVEAKLEAMLAEWSSRAPLRPPPEPKPRPKQAPAAAAKPSRPARHHNPYMKIVR